MKKIYIVGGTMGVGKTAVCQELKRILDRAVFLDGDWCWDADPFQVTDETKAMVLTNICFLLNRFLQCSAYENVVFCWVMHEQAILDAIVNNLDVSGCDVITVSLTAEEETLRERLEKDIAEGKRTDDILARSISRLPLYRELNTVKVPTDGKTVREIAAAIERLGSARDRQCY